MGKIEILKTGITSYDIDALVLPRCCSSPIRWSMCYSGS